MSKQKIVQALAASGAGLSLLVAALATAPPAFADASTTNATSTNATSTSATTSPSLSGVTSVATDTAATITWTTSVAADTQVEYGTTSVYSIFSAYDPTAMMSHSLTLLGLTPGTLYHFAVISGIASSTGLVADRTFATTSPDMTFTTATSATSTGTTTNTGTSTTTAPVISAVLATPTSTGVTITWTTNQPSGSQVAWGPTASYGNTTTLDNTQVTSHSVLIGGLTANTMYHFQVLSGIGSSTAATSSDMNFTTLMSTTTGTTTPGSGDIQALQQQITSLQQQINQLWALLLGLLNGGGNNNGTTTPPMTGSASIDQNGTTVNAGGGIDFGGRGFGKEEHVNVMLNGSQVGQAFTNSTGSFSTGSMSVPTTPGTYTYTFVGQDSGISAQAAITVH